LILLTRQARQMIELAVAEEPTLEVSGFGRVKIEGSSIVVTNIFIPPQEVGSVHTDIEGDNLRIALEAFLRANSTLADWAFWWHSHCSMSVGPSGQDLETLELLAGEVPTLGWFAGMVTNVKGDYHGWINVTKPVPVTTKLNVFCEEDPVPKKLRERVADMMKNVKKKTYTAAAWTPAKGAAHTEQCICWNCVRSREANVDEAELERELAGYLDLGGGPHQ